MLYVFIVSSGTMMKFDMNLAVKKVIELKTEIFNSVNIPVENQVLLCSGGEQLKSDNIVGNYYGAGTDTNPIFLFSKYPAESELIFNTHLKTSIDLSIEDDVNGCASMTPSIGAATVRSTLAQRFADAAVNGRRECDELVHGQHLQQQGWAAVIANLEDSKDYLLKLKSHFEELFQKYLANRNSYKEIIKRFPSDVQLLEKIPLLPKLMLGNECLEEDLVQEHTLLSWFCSEPRQVLESLGEKCHRSLEELNEHSLMALNEDIQSVLKNADNQDIKEVKGIEERLSSLNKQIEDAKKLEKDQRDLAAWFNQYQGMIARDPQVLPDLCGTFQKQLELMLQNHKCLRDILERCTKAKLELSDSINFRVKYICRVENEIYELQVRIIFLEKHIQSLMSQIESFRQVHLAPQRYLNMLAEVCRRKTFSTSYLKWATELSTQAFKLYKKEVSLRKSFKSEESRNMVDNLFPGMDDLLPPFAIECPQPFDQNLPNIVKEDFEWLRFRFPELSHFCEVLPPEPMPYISQAESDSAFSSNIPSSRIVGDSADSGGKPQTDNGEMSPHKLAAPSGDCNSLPSECTSLPNEVFSLTSSPFEDPLILNAGLEINRTKSTSQHSGLSISAAVKGAFSVERHTVAADSDGEEFETVDRYGTSVDISPQLTRSKNRVSASRPTSSSDVIDVNKNEYHCPKISKARSDGDALSPIQDRLKSSDSLIVSTDFQAAEYYIDDSMPSSYTESNATSPLMRGNKMVKSHHVVLAELQRQVEDKNGALIGATSSLKNSRCNILKLHAKISALQRYIQELQGGLRSDLCNFKSYVKEEFGEKMSEVSHLIENINSAMVELQQQMNLEKEKALTQAKSDTADLENAYILRLEVENQKLNDVENQIVNYEEHLQEVTSSYEEIRNEKEQIEAELNFKKELIKSMMLEHELELDSLRNQMNQEVQNKDCKLVAAIETSSQLQAEIEKLQHDKNVLEQTIDILREENASTLASLEQCRSDHSALLKEQKLLTEELLRYNEQKDSKPLPEADGKFLLVVEENMQSMKDELEKMNIKLVEAEKSKAEELKLLEEKLTSKHRNDLESLRSRYKLAVSTTSIERLPSLSSFESLDSETLLGVDDIKKFIAETREKWVAEKEESVKAVLEAEHKKLKEAVVDAVNSEQLKFEEERKKIASDLQQEYMENFEKLKQRFTAENQVSFNEAINRLAKEKDATIEDLRSQISVLVSKQVAIKSHLDNYCASSETITETENVMLSQSDSGSSSSYKMSHTMEESRFLASLRKELEPYLQLTESMACALAPSPECEENLEYYKTRLRNKEDDCKRLVSKFMNLAGKTSCFNCSSKISILTCDVGDLILLYYKEKHENFVVFHFGQYTHFLHTDSLSALDLKIPAVPSDRWVLGFVTSKQFCITRKATNRYKVTLGTKFYRVKVRPWDRETAIEIQQWHRSNQMGSEIYASSTLNAQQPPTEDGDGAKSSCNMSTSAV